MNKEKCRLCLCTTDSRAGISSSINDESFGAIIKNVFRFALPTFDTVGGRKNKLPVLVCFQCSNTVRNFHYFSEHVKANQKKLQSKSDKNQQHPKPRGAISNHWSIDELIEHIKRGSGEDETSPIAENDMEIVYTYSDSEAQDRIDDNSFARESNEESCGSFLTFIESPKCVEKGELVGTLETMDKRVDVVTKQLGLLIQNLAHNQRLTKKRRFERRTSFEFTPMTRREDMDSFNQQLNDEEYRAKVLDWLDFNIDANDSENRMHQSLDLIFARTFFPEIGWTGRTITGIEKIALRNYIQIIKLIQSIGRTDIEIVTNRQVQQFLIRKLRYAKCRVHIPLRRTSCHKIAKKKKIELKQVSQ